MTEPGPITIIGAHSSALFMHVTSVPKEGETVLGWGYEEPDDGGKATNQAVAAARLGGPVVAVTVLGNDARGLRARASLEQAGVDTRWVIVADGPTDIGFVMLPPSKIPAITSLQERSRDLDERVVEAAADLIRSSYCVVCQLEAPRPTAIRAFRIARHAGVRTVLNPTPADNVGRTLLSLTDVLVANEHEAATLAGHNVSPERATREVSRRWPEMDIVVTAGRAGAWVASRGRADIEHIAAPTVEKVVDTTGAGDAFLGALVVRLREGDELARAASFAVRAASVSVARAGTIPAFATLGDLDLP